MREKDREGVCKRVREGACVRDRVREKKRDRRQIDSTRERERERKGTRRRGEEVYIHHFVFLADIKIYTIANTPLPPSSAHRQQHTAPRHTTRTTPPRRFASRQSFASLRRDRPTLSPPIRAPSLPLLSRPTHPRLPFSPSPFPSPAPYVRSRTLAVHRERVQPPPLTLLRHPCTAGWMDRWMDG